MFAVNIGTSHLKNAHANRPTVETALEKIEAKRSSEPFVAKRKVMDILAEQQLSTTHPVSVNVHRAILENIALHNRPFLSVNYRCQLIFANTSPKKVTSGRRKQKITGPVSNTVYLKLVQKQIYWTCTSFTHSSLGYGLRATGQPAERAGPGRPAGP